MSTAAPDHRRRAGCGAASSPCPTDRRPARRRRATSQRPRPGHLRVRQRRRARLRRRSAPPNGCYLRDPHRSGYVAPVPRYEADTVAQLLDAGHLRLGATHRHRRPPRRPARRARPHAPPADRSPAGTACNAHRSGAAPARAPARRRRAQPGARTVDLRRTRATAAPPRPARPRCHRCRPRGTDRVYRTEPTSRPAPAAVAGPDSASPATRDHPARPRPSTATSSRRHRPTTDRRQRTATCSSRPDTAATSSTPPTGSDASPCHHTRGDAHDQHRAHARTDDRDTR